MAKKFNTETKRDKTNINPITPISLEDLEEYFRVQSGEPSYRQYKVAQGKSKEKERKKQELMSKGQTVLGNSLTDFGTGLLTWGTELRPPTEYELERNRYDANKGTIGSAYEKSKSIARAGSFGLADVMTAGAMSNIGKGNRFVTNFTPTNKAADVVGDFKPKFKSEIDWSKWNPDTPKYKILMDEHNAIEESTKKAGTWMKNPDGSVFQGTPEQFIQEQSSHFKKAFPEGHNEVYRGVRGKTTVRELNPEKAVYTADKDLAKSYSQSDKILGSDATFNTISNNQTQMYLNPDIDSGIFHLAHKKSPNSIELDNFHRPWTSVDLTDPKISIDNIKSNLKHQYEQLAKQKEFFKSGKQNPDGSWSFPNSDDVFSNELYQRGTKDYEQIIKSWEDRLVNADNLIKNKSAHKSMREALGRRTTTDDIAKYVEDANLDFVKIKNVVDGGVGDDVIVNHKRGNYLKSLVGNVGFFDMTNPDIYKGLVPASIGAKALTNNTEDMKQYKDGGSLNIPNLLPEVTVTGKDLRRRPAKPKPVYDKSYLDWFLREPINKEEIAASDSLRKVQPLPLPLPILATGGQLTKSINSNFYPTNYNTPMLGFGDFLKNNAGVIGSVVGGIGGAFLGNPMLGAKVGGTIGGALEGETQSQKDAALQKQMAEQQKMLMLQQYSNNTMAMGGNISGGEVNNSQGTLKERLNTLHESKLNEPQKIINEKVWLKDWMSHPEFTKRLSTNLKDINDKKSYSSKQFPISLFPLKTGDDYWNDKAETVKTNAIDRLHSTKEFYAEGRDNNKKLVEELGKAFYPSDEDKAEYHASSNRFLSSGTYNPQGHSIFVNSLYNTPGTAAHEYTHATKLDDLMIPILPTGGVAKREFERIEKEHPGFKIKEGYYGSPYLTNEENKGTFSPIKTITLPKDTWKTSTDDLKYLNRSSEVYPRIMLIRYQNDIKPGEIIDKNRMQLIKEKSGQDGLFKMYDDEQVMDLLNTLADSGIQNGNDNMMKYGGLLPSYENGGKVGVKYVNQDYRYDDPKWWEKSSGRTDFSPVNIESALMLPKLGAGVAKGVGNFAKNWFNPDIVSPFVSFPTTFLAGATGVHVGLDAMGMPTRTPQDSIQRQSNTQTGFNPPSQKEEVGDLKDPKELYNLIMGNKILPSKKKAMGGSLQPDNITMYAEGGSHESNPHGGIPLGNKARVEQNEVRFNSKKFGDYIFSDRLFVE